MQENAMNPYDPHGTNHPLSLYEARSIHCYTDGERVWVGPAYQMGGTYASDAWTGREMVVVDVAQNDFGLAALDAAPGDEPEVWLVPSRMLPEALAPDTLRHLQSWLDHAEYPEDHDRVRSALIALVLDDPDVIRMGATWPALVSYLRNEGSL